MQLTVTLSRDSYQTSWGFRLQGGVDFNQPLSVQRVFTNSPADGELQRGDMISTVNHQSTAHMVHKMAMDAIRESGGTLTLQIERGSSGYMQQATEPKQKLGINFAPRFLKRPTGNKSGSGAYGGNMLPNAVPNPGYIPTCERIQQTLDHLAISGGPLPSEDQYRYGTIGMRKKNPHGNRTQQWNGRARSTPMSPPHNEQRYPPWKDTLGPTAESNKTPWRSGRTRSNHRTMSDLGTNFAQPTHQMGTGRIFKPSQDLYAMIQDSEPVATSHHSPAVNKTPAHSGSINQSTSFKILQELTHTNQSEESQGVGTEF